MRHIISRKRDKVAKSRLDYRRNEFGKILLYEGHWRDSLPQFEGDYLFESSMFNDFEFYELFGENFNAVFRNNKLFYGSVDDKGRFSGQGVYVEHKGVIFRGEFYEGNWAKGDLTFRCNRRYSGQFFQNVFFGKGRLEKPNGEVYTGLFEDGKYQGKGKQVLPNGNVYRGMFKQGFRHGATIEEFPDGKVLLGKYCEGSRHGKFYEKRLHQPGKFEYSKMTYNMGVLLSKKKINERHFLKKNKKY